MDLSRWLCVWYLCFMSATISDVFSKSESVEQQISQEEIAYLLNNIGLNRGSTLVLFRDSENSNMLTEVVDDWSLRNGVFVMSSGLSDLDDFLQELMQGVMETKSLAAYYSKLNFVVFCDCCVVEIHSKILYMDKQFGKSSLLRHFSKWLFVNVCGVNGDVNLLLSVLDNIAVVVYTDKQHSHPYRRSPYMRSSCIDILTLMWSGGGRKWNAILKQNRLGNALQLTGPLFPNSQRGLNGRRLSVAVMEWGLVCRKVRQNNNPVMYSHACKDIFDYLAASLNFSYEFVEPPDDKWGEKLSNSTWNGLLGLLVNGIADVSAIPYAITTERSEVVTFSYGLWSSKCQVSYRRQFSHRDEWTSLLACFKWDVYLCGGGVLVWVLALILLLEHRSGKTTVHNSDFGSICVAVIAAPLHQGSVYVSSGLSGRLLHVSWWFFCIVITAVYTGNLLAFLTVEKERIPFTTLEELAENPDFKIIVSRGTNVEGYIRASNVSVMKALWRRIEATRPQTTTTTPEEYEQHKELLAAGGYALIHMSERLNDVDTSHLGRMSADVIAFPMNLPFPLLSPLEPLFSKQIMYMRESGLIEAMRKRWTKDKKRDREIQAVSITVADLKTVFVACVFGVVVSVGCLVLEHVWKCYKTNRVTEHR